MLLNGSELLDTVLLITFGALSISFVFAIIRLILGPSLPDRVVALDLIAYITIGFIGTFVIYTKSTHLLDVATVLALIAFLATAAFARYVKYSTETNEDT